MHLPAQLHVTMDALACEIPHCSFVSFPEIYIQRITLFSMTSRAYNASGSTDAKNSFSISHVYVSGLGDESRL